MIVYVWVIIVIWGLCGTLTICPSDFAKKVYSASNLKRPLEVVTFLHRLYLPKLVHVARFYFHAHSTTRLNQNLCKRVLTALSQCQLILSSHFLVTSQALSFQSWRFVARSKQMTSVFWESLADRICRWANQISRVESCFLHKTVMQLWRWAAQQKSYRIGALLSAYCL